MLLMAGRVLAPALLLASALRTAALASVLGALLSVLLTEAALSLVFVLAGLS